MEALLAHCTAEFAAHGALWLAFFLAGLTGGFTHCLTMCGPFVACERSCAAPSCGKNLRGSLSLSYHLGRFTVYGLLGFLAALLSKQIATTSWWPLLSSAMLAGAGILFLLSFFKSCTHSDVPKAPSLTYLRGVMLGFLPCGLLYAALMMAATLANPFGGMVAMWLFTLGTMPALLIAGGSAELLTRRWQHTMQMLGQGMMAFNGLSLLVMAARTMR